MFSTFLSSEEISSTSDENKQLMNGKSSVISFRKLGFDIFPFLCGTETSSRV